MRHTLEDWVFYHRKWLCLPGIAIAQTAIFIDIHLLSFFKMTPITLAIYIKRQIAMCDAVA